MQGRDSNSSILESAGLSGWVAGRGSRKGKEQLDRWHWTNWVRDLKKRFRHSRVRGLTNHFSFVSVRYPSTDIQRPLNASYGPGGRSPGVKAGVKYATTYTHSRDGQWATDPTYTHLMLRHWIKADFVATYELRGKESYEQFQCPLWVWVKVTFLHDLLLHSDHLVWTQLHRSSYSEAFKRTALVNYLVQDTLSSFGLWKKIFNFSLSHFLL